MRKDAMRKVSADLCERIDGLTASVPHGATPILCAKAADVRRIAQQYELRPVVDLAWKLESRLARGERGPSVSAMLQLMREATECGRADPHAIHAWAAAASTRLM